MQRLGFPAQATSSVRGGNRSARSARVRHCPQTGILPRRRLTKASARHSLDAGRVGRSTGPSRIRPMDSAVGVGATVEGSESLTPTQPPDKEFRLFLSLSNPIKVY